MRPFLRGIDRMRCGTVLSVLLGAVVGLAGAETSDAEQVALRQSKTLDFKRAAASFAALRGALQRTDGRVDLLIKEADCLYSRGEEKRAQTLLEDYLKRKPQDPDCVHVLLFRALVPLEHHIDLNTTERKVRDLIRLVQSSDRKSWRAQRHFRWRMPTTAFSAICVPPPPWVRGSGSFQKRGTGSSALIRS